LVVQDCGCVALLNLTDNDQNCILVAEAGGIGTLVAMLQQHESDPDLQAYGCGVLWNMTSTEDNMEKARLAGALAVVETALRQHGTHELVNEWGTMLANRLRST
jgi:Armadillo/beta-catenin-like repeat